jgi:hypothetical protein
VAVLAPRAKVLTPRDYWCAHITVQDRTCNLKNSLSFLSPPLRSVPYVELHLSAMTIEEILLHIDAEISRLTEARDLVAGTAVTKVARSPRKSGLVAPKPRALRTKRVISPEGRARIAAAQKLRWAKQKRSKEKH